MITLGGVTVTGAEIAQVLDALLDTPGDQMRRYLKGTPLEGMDYHKVHDEEIKHFPEIRVSPGTKQHHVAHVKPACIHAMKRVLSESGWHDLQAAPETDNQAYKPPPPGGQKQKSQVFKTNPDKIDRGTAGHKKTQNALAEALCQANLKPWSPKPHQPQFDIAWRDNDIEGVTVAFIGEVKSLTNENETWQIRLAIGQVVDYVHMLDSLRNEGSLPPDWDGVQAIRGVVAVERQPTKAEYWTGLCERLGIILTWPEKYHDTLASMH